MPCKVYQELIRDRRIDLSHAPAHFLNESRVHFSSSPFALIRQITKIPKTIPAMNARIISQISIVITPDSRTIA
jgi:hypothetical protein